MQKLRKWMRLETTSDDLLHLDLMRFIASAGIVLCHSGEFFVSQASRASFNERMAGLSLFVDVFFVISGFVIAHVYTERMGNWRDFAKFMQRRIGRLYPLHIATLAAMAMLFYVVGKLGVATNSDMRLVPECLVLGTFLLHAVVDCGGPVPNGVNWSISAEMVMYVLFPLLLLLFTRLGKLRYVAVAALLAVTASRYAPGEGWGTDTQFWRALPAFALGLALRLDWKDIAKVRVPGTVAIACALGLTIGSLLIWPNWLLVTLAYASAIAAIAADGTGRAAPLTRRLAPLGQLTYSMYMLHPIIILVLVNAIGDKLLKLEGAALIALTLLSYAVIYVVSLLSYKWFETPARRYIDRLPLVPAPKGGVKPHV